MKPDRAFALLALILRCDGNQSAMARSESARIGKVIKRQAIANRLMRRDYAGKNLLEFASEVRAIMDKAGKRVPESRATLLATLARFESVQAAIDAGAVGADAWARMDEMGIGSVEIEALRNNS